jgi:flagellin
VVINTNYAATVASNNLAASNSSLQRSLNRLSSGSKIVAPSDDAGGLAVSMKLAAASKRQGSVANNVGNAVSYLQTQDGALKVAGKILDRMSELRTLYSDATKNTSDQANYDTEFKALSAQLNAITSEKFNGISLFASSGNDKTIYATEDLSSTTAITVAARDLSNSSSGVGALSNNGTVSMTSGITLDTIKTAIENVATMRAANGAEQSRLSFAGELLTVNKANLEAANSRIIDVDVAQESTQLARWNILVQSGTAMLAQANGSAQTALQLLGYGAGVNS